ncbi:unnamed protein product [Heterobilharzia americana]|nr:unnamed protein product [Heterobilharzia americana]
MRSERCGEALLPPSAFIVTTSDKHYSSRDLVHYDMKGTINSTINDKGCEMLIMDSNLTELAWNSTDVSYSKHFELDKLDEKKSDHINKLVHTLMKENAYLLHSRTDALNQLNKLRAYIELGKTSSENAFNIDLQEPSHKCICDTELLEKLKYLENKNSQLSHELEQTNIRMHSLQAILEIQEKQLCNNKSDYKILDTNYESEKVERLLNTWRRHVLRLLIEIENLKKLESLKANLEESEFKLKARDATLDIEQNKRQGLERDLKDLNTKLSITQLNMKKSQENYFEFASNTKNQLCQIFKLIQSFMNISETNIIDQRFHEPTTVYSIFHRLRQLERRLNFANSRLPLLRTHLLLLLHNKSKNIITSFTDQSIQTDCGLKFWIENILSESEKEEIITQAQNEAYQAIRERDQALEQLSDYVKSFDERVHNAEKAVETELCNLREENRILNMSLYEEQKKFKECSDHLQNEKLAYNDAKQKYTDENTLLKVELTETQMKLTKALSELRRTERRIDREINERKQQINDMENNYKSKIQTLENALHSFYPESYHCYDNIPKSSDIIQNMTKPIIPTFANHIDVDQSIRKLDHLINRFNSDLSSSSSSDLEDEKVVDR